ncbi:MAG TPA: hypothetical protein PK200_11460 [Spirochaetota bacterium]|nr:hypothetical protein [Spirochaetota bacterium]
MKKIYVSVLLVFSVICISSTLHSEGGSEWVVKIDNQKIMGAELDELYYAHHRQLFHQIENTGTLSNAHIDSHARNKSMVKQIPTLDKKLFLQELINQKLLINQAVAEGYRKKNEVVSLLKMAESTTLVQYFLFDKFRNDITVSDSEVKAFYDQNKKRFPNDSLESVSPKIKQFLSMQKMREKIISYLNILKESSRIERNMSSEINR